MPSKNKTTPALNSLSLFVALLILSLFLWFIYRSIFSFPVFFDETVGKALFFGLPILIYVNMTGLKALIESLSLTKIKPGLLRGLAFGGLFGFVGVITSYLMQGGSIVKAPLFVLDKFWWELFLAMLTSFWETLFFFVFIQQVLKKELTEASLFQRVILVTVIFLIFHVPNSILRFSGIDVVMQLLLMAMFGLGQALLFENYPNAYTLILTQTMWGMVLLVHF